MNQLFKITIQKLCSVMKFKESPLHYECYGNHTAAFITDTLR